MAYIHGRRYTTEYVGWVSMRQRCFNRNHSSWNDYGGRGITVCERWQTFENFYADMGPKPEGLTLDRIDNDGNYEPANCRWATVAEQQQNRRKKHVDSRSRYPGVSRHRNKWQARAYFNGERVSLGVFSNEQDAAQCCINAESVGMKASK